MSGWRIQAASGIQIIDKPCDAQYMIKKTFEASSLLNYRANQSLGGVSKKVSDRLRCDSDHPVNGQQVR